MNHRKNDVKLNMILIIIIIVTLRKIKKFQRFTTFLIKSTLFSRLKKEIMIDNIDLIK
jgi:hypothetical protein